MKKLLALLLAAVLVFSFAGCANKKESAESEHDAMLIGKWESKKTESAEAVGWTMEFKENGELSEYPSEEQKREFAEKIVEENIKSLGSLEKVLENSGFKTKEELIAMHTEAIGNEFKRTDLYWKTHNGILKRYNTKSDYENDNYDENGAYTYKISEDEKELTLYHGEDIIGEYVKA